MKIKKRTLVFGSIFFIVFVFLFFLSTIIKSYVNNNSKELIGRKVELGNININYFKVAVRVTDLVAYETNEKDTFAGFKELYINFDPWKLIHNEYSFSTIKLDSLYAYVIQDGDVFNFSDLIPADDSTTVEPTDTLPAKPLHFSVYNIHFTRGKLDFYDKQIDNRLLFDDLDLHLPKIAWDNQKSEMGAEFEFGNRGLVSIGADIDHQLNRYHLAIGMQNMSLEPISNYVEQYANIDGISGFFHANINIDGNIENTSDIIVSGSAAVDTFRMWEPGNKDFFTLKHGAVNFDSLDLGRASYNLSSIDIVEPVLTATLNKDQSNIERVFQAYLVTDSTAIEETAANETDSIPLTYRIDSINVQGAKVLFTDNTLNRPFQYDLKDIDVSLGCVSESADKVPVKFSVNLNNQGNLDGSTTFSLVDPYNLSVKAQLKKMRLMGFSPYTEYYICYPITKGDFNYDLSIEMTKAEMINENNITIKEMEFGSKTKDTTGIKAPIKLGLYLMKDPKDVISINLPVSGNPTDPDFSVSKLVWKAFLNLMIKTAASPFNALGKLVSTQPEELETLPFEYAQDSLNIDQKATLNKIATILAKKPELIFTFSQQTYVDVEKDSLAISMAKKQMLVNKIKPSNEKEFEKYHQLLKNLNSSDPSLLRYLKKDVAGADTLTLPTACRKLIGEDELDDAFNKLLNARTELVRYYLIDERQVDSTSIDVRISDLRNIPEQLKSPKFDVEVSVK
nr:DUF748 domain-containing protein [uncultured Carboxylicivirga sp.]